MKITISGPQFAEAIQAAEWVIRPTPIWMLMLIGREWAEASCSGLERP